MAAAPVWTIMVEPESSTIRVNDGCPPPHMRIPGIVTYDLVGRLVVLGLLSRRQRHTTPPHITRAPHNAEAEGATNHGEAVASLPG